MRTRPIPVLTATLLLAIGIAGCGRDEEAPPPQPTETPTLPTPAVPETVPPPGPTSSPGGTIPEPSAADGTAAMPAAPVTEATAGPVAGADRSFIAEATTSGIAEAEAGKLAAEKASDPQVKAFGEKLREDHSAANMKLAQLASTKGITPSETLEGAPRTHLDELAKLSGAEFDRAFLEHFGAAAHEDAIQLFERQAKEGQDPDIRAFAEQALATLRTHLQTAQQLAQAGK